MLKILHVPDLHLYDKEIGVSIGYAEQSVDILNIIKDEFIQGEYDLVTLGGDIQHAKINNTRYISIFQRMLKDIGILVKNKLEEKGLLNRLKVYDKEGKLIDLSGREGVLFSVRGQHDTNNIEEFTFFDLLIENEVLMNPRIVTLDGLQLNFINYSRNPNELVEKKLDTTEVLIGIYHNPILEKGVFIDTIIGKTISPGLHNLFRDVDLAIINDIHIPIPIYEVAKGESKTTVITPGSLGRTSFNKSHDRDFGNMVKVEVDENYDLKVELVEVDLIPSDEFFNKAEALKKKRTENAFNNFCLEIEDAKINYFDIYEELNRQVKDEEIREICFEILKQVD